MDHVTLLPYWTRDDFPIFYSFTRYLILVKCGQSIASREISKRASHAELSLNIVLE